MTWAILAVAAGLTVVGWRLGRVRTRAYLASYDPEIEALITANSAWRSSRRRWTTFDPDLRTQTGAKRQREAAVRAKANLIAASPVGARREPLSFERTR